MAEWYVNKNPVLESCVFTTGKSSVQRLATAIANITAMSLKVLADEICERTKFNFLQ